MSSDATLTPDQELKPGYLVIITKWWHEGDTVPEGWATIGSLNAERVNKCPNCGEKQPAKTSAELPTSNLVVALRSLIPTYDDMRAAADEIERLTLALESEQRATGPWVVKEDYDRLRAALEHIARMVGMATDFQNYARIALAGSADTSSACICRFGEGQQEDCPAHGRPAVEPSGAKS